MVDKLKDIELSSYESYVGRLYMFLPLNNLWFWFGMIVIAVLMIIVFYNIGNKVSNDLSYLQKLDNNLQVKFQSNGINIDRTKYLKFKIKEISSDLIENAEVKEYYLILDETRKSRKIDNISFKVIITMIVSIVLILIYMVVIHNLKSTYVEENLAEAYIKEESKIDFTTSEVLEIKNYKIKSEYKMEKDFKTNSKEYDKLYQKLEYEDNYILENDFVKILYKTKEGNVDYTYEYVKNIEIVVDSKLKDNELLMKYQKYPDRNSYSDNLTTRLYFGLDELNRKILYGESNIVLYIPSSYEKTYLENGNLINLKAWKD